MSQAIFGRQGIDGVQSARSLCHLAQRYGRDRLNQACRRALDFKATRYREVKQILLAEQEKPAVLRRKGDFGNLCNTKKRNNAIRQKNGGSDRFPTVSRTDVSYG
jgi:hypothetical protein